MTALAYSAIGMNCACCAYQVLHDYLKLRRRWIVWALTAVAVVLYVIASTHVRDQGHMMILAIVSGFFSIALTFTLIAAITRQSWGAVMDRCLGRNRD